MKIPELERIERLLWEEWDPIGVQGTGCPDDEYDSYAMQVFSKLSRGASVAEIESYLDWVETERMGLSGLVGRNNEIAQKIVGIHQSFH